MAEIKSFNLSKFKPNDIVAMFQTAFQRNGLNLTFPTSDTKALLIVRKNTTTVKTPRGNYIKMQLKYTLILQSIIPHHLNILYLLLLHLE
jgi:hypothetical protein